MLGFAGFTSVVVVVGDRAFGLLSRVFWGAEAVVVDDSGIRRVLSRKTALRRIEITGSGNDLFSD
jgi:hypothetical protein